MAKKLLTHFIDDKEVTESKFNAEAERQYKKDIDPKDVMRNLCNSKPIEFGYLKWLKGYPKPPPDRQFERNDYTKTYEDKAE